jgi:hypothetical protein
MVSDSLQARRWLGPRSIRRAALCVALALTGLANATRFARAQSEPEPVHVDPAVVPEPSVDPTEMDRGDVGRKAPKRVTPFAAPVPFKNSQVGWGLFVMVGAIHRFDADTTLKPSTGAGGGFYTDNGSWGVMALENARLRGDALRLRGMLSHMDIRYDFFGIGEDAGQAGISVPLRQKMDIVIGSALFRMMPNFYGGVATMWMQSTLALREDLPPELPDLPEFDEARGALFAPGLQTEYDSRDDDYWPTRGSLGSIKGWFFVDALGASQVFQRYVTAWSWYQPLQGRRLVLATNLNGAFASGEVPFFMLPSLGTGRYGLRGYTQGRYRDKVMITAQTEARFHTEGRLGATVFAGFGQVAPQVVDLIDAAVLPAGGLGLRYQLTRQFPMHMRLDYAWGKNGNLLYFSVSEAF